ncbi:hypothetical protein CRG98_003392 [Punica granatum]|uniref:Uncharacterized protein n=1 Tax=Punica granatum TaxID=22663 RepID=A0A2I0L6E5_PUNGR|nr:hypothetical protein CRG98_003392 [Punica granatum]
MGSEVKRPQCSDSSLEFSVRFSLFSDSPARSSDDLCVLSLILNYFWVVRARKEFGRNLACGDIRVRPHQFTSVCLRRKIVQVQWMGKLTQVWW